MRSFRVVWGVIAVFVAFGALTGCSSELDNKVDESKLPPMPKNGGPTAGGAMAPGGAPTGDKAPVKAVEPKE